jgi:hypothetical protein
MQLLIDYYFIRNVNLIKIELKDFSDDDDLDSNVLLTASQDGYAKV